MQKSAGYSLIEVIVVLLVVALISTLAAQTVSPGPNSGTPLQVAKRLGDFLRAVRRDAVLDREEKLLRIDTQERVIRSDDPSNVFAVPANMGFLFKGLGLDSRGGVEGRLRFYPDGTSSGAVIVLEKSAQRASVQADWMTGLVWTENQHE